MSTIKLKFIRTAKVKEVGAVSIDISDTTSIADAYKKAYEKLFKEFLCSERTYSNEEWDFELLKEENEPTNDHDPAA